MFEFFAIFACKAHVGMGKNTDIYTIFIIVFFIFSIWQELKESFNYGLFCPPSNGKAGKFLDEERRLGDYPFNGPVGYLEVSGTRASAHAVSTIHTQVDYFHNHHVHPKQ